MISITHVPLGVKITSVSGGSTTPSTEISKFAFAAEARPRTSIKINKLFDIIFLFCPQKRHAKTYFFIDL
jgi:hypothetical protein